MSPTRIEVDGVDAGHPLDYYANNPAQRAAVKTLFVEWNATHVIREQERDAEVLAHKAAIAADAAAKKQAYEEAAAAAFESARVSYERDAADLEASVQALGVSLEELEQRAELAEERLAELIEVEPVDGPAPEVEP